MNVGKVDPLVAAEGRARANQDVELRLSITNLVPDSRMVEGGGGRFPAFLGRQCRTDARVPGRQTAIET